MSSQPHKRSRVVIALEATLEDDFALEIARDLVASASPELLGIFVENVRLLDYARSRLAREIMLTGRERPLDARQLERQIRAQSARVKARFEAVASKLGLPHMFQVTRGELIAELVERAAEAEALVLSIARQSGTAARPVDPAIRRLFEAPPRAVLFLRDGWRGGGSVLALIDSGDLSDPALEAAARLAKQSGSPLTVVLSGTALAQREQTLRLLRGHLRSRGVDLDDVVALRHASAQGLAQAARICRARLVVMPAGDTDLILELLGRLSSALLLVRRE